MASGRQQRGQTQQKHSDHDSIPYESGPAHAGNVRVRRIPGEGGGGRRRAEEERRAARSAFAAEGTAECCGFPKPCPHGASPENVSTRRRVRGAGFRAGTAGDAPGTGGFRVVYVRQLAGNRPSGNAYPGFSGTEQNDMAAFFHARPSGRPREGERAEAGENVRSFGFSSPGNLSPSSHRAHVRLEGMNVEIVHAQRCEDLHLGI